MALSDFNKLAKRLTLFVIIIDTIGAIFLISSVKIVGRNLKKT